MVVLVKLKQSLWLVIFLWENGTILCMPCNGQPINEARRMKRHTTYSTRKNNIKAREGKEVKKVVTLQQLKNVKSNTERQYSVPLELHAYRCEALKEVAKANIYQLNRL